MRYGHFLYDSSHFKFQKDKRYSRPDIARHRQAPPYRAPILHGLADDEAVAALFRNASARFEFRMLLMNMKRILLPFAAELGSRFFDGDGGPIEDEMVSSGANSCRRCSMILVASSFAAPL